MDRSAVMQSAGLLGGALVGIAVARYRPRRALGTRARNVRRALPATAANLDGCAGEEIVIEGTLVALHDGARVPAVITAVPRGAEQLEETTPKALTLGAELGVRLDAAPGRAGVVVALEGRVQVLVGSADTGRAVPAARARAWLHDLAHAALPSTEVSLRSLSAGDRVLAAGVLRAVAAGDSPTDYRGRAGAHVLVAPAGGTAGFVTLVFAGAPRPLGGRAASRAVHALAGVVAVLGLIAGVRAVPVATVPSSLPQDTCPADLDARIDAGDTSSAAESAEACGDDLRAARARWLLADFDRASRALLRARRADRTLAPSRTEISAHLLAGRHAEAAAAARDLAARGVLKDASRGKLLRCLADALDVRAGDTQAQGRLRAQASGHPMCPLLLADTLQGTARLTALPPPVGSWYAWTPTEIAASLLRREVKPDEPLPYLDFYPSGALMGPGTIVLPHALGLVDAGRSSPGAHDPWRAAGLDLIIGTLQSYVGEHADAAEDVRRALSRGDLVDAGPAPRASAGDLFRYRPPAGDPDVRRDHRLAWRRAFFYAAVLATRAHEVENARAYLALASEESYGAELLRPVLVSMDEPHLGAMRELRDREGWAPNRKVWNAALTGEPEQLAIALRETHTDGRAVIPFVAPWATGGSPALRGWITAAYPQACWTCGVPELVDHLAARREVADALRERVLAGQLRAPLLRLRDALLQRDLAVPLLALDQVTRG